MQTDSFTISLKNMVFSPFKSFKSEPSFGLALAIIALTTTLIVVLKTLEPTLSFAYVVSVVIKAGINISLSVVAFFIVAAIYTLISKVIIGKGHVVQIFKLLGVSLLPSVALLSLYLLALSMGLVSAATKEDFISIISLIAGVWSVAILAGGIKNIYSVSTEKAIIVAIVCAILPMVLLIVSVLVFLGVYLF